MFNVRKAEEIAKTFESVREMVDDLRSTGVRDFLSIKQTCNYLSISRTHLYYLRKQRVFQESIIGRKKVVIIKKSIDDYVVQSRHESCQTMGK